MNSDACTICLDNLGEHLASASCGHVFHFTCINEWFSNFTIFCTHLFFLRLASHQACPLCKRKIFSNGKSQARELILLDFNPISSLKSLSVSCQTTVARMVSQLALGNTDELALKYCQTLLNAEIEQLSNQLAHCTARCAELETKLSRIRTQHENHLSKLAVLYCQFF